MNFLYNFDVCMIAKTTYGLFVYIQVHKLNPSCFAVSIKLCKQWSLAIVDLISSPELQPQMSFSDCLLSDVYLSVCKHFIVSSSPEPLSQLHSNMTQNKASLSERTHLFNNKENSILKKEIMFFLT